MIYRCFFILFVIQLCGLHFAVAQDPSVIPPSPEVNRIMEYQRIRSQEFHGLPVIGIPLYEINSGHLNSQISLSYNFSGFRPHETFSRTGIGFDMTAGGVVTRTINGVPDDASAGHLRYTNAIMDVSQFNSFTPLQEFEHLREVAWGQVDSEYDIFSYSMGGRSDSFILVRTTTGTGVRAVSLSGDTTTKIIPDIDIFAIVSNLRGFTVVTEGGVSYKFGENAAIERYYGVIDSRTTSWFLTSIIDVNNTDTIRFEYEPTFRTIHTDDSFISDDQQIRYYDATSGFQTIEDIGPNMVINSSSYITKYLQKISFRGGTVDFTYSSDVLSRIAVNNPYAQEVSSFDFHYSALTSDHPHMKLDSLELFDGTAYRFDYHDAPSYFTYGHSSSYSRDWYGYYNRSGHFYNSKFALSNFVITSAFRREPDFNHTKSFALYRLTYPTKGNNEFVWEQNKVLSSSNQLVDFAGLRIKEVRYNPIEGKGFIEEYKYGNNENGAGYPSLEVADDEIVQSFLNYWPCSYCDFLNYNRTYKLNQYKPVPRSYPRNVYYLNVAKYVSESHTGARLKESSEYSIPLFHYHRIRSGYLHRYWLQALGPAETTKYHFPLYEYIVTNDSRASQLKKKSYYEFQNGLYGLIKSEEYNYRIDVYPSYSGFKVHRLAEYGFYTNGMYQPSVDMEPQLVLGYSNASFAQHNVAPVAYKPIIVQPSRTYLESKRIVEYYGTDSSVTVLGFYDQGMFFPPVTTRLYEEFYANSTTSWSQRNVYGLAHSGYGMMIAGAFQTNYNNMIAAMGSVNYYPLLGKETFRGVDDFTSITRSATVTDVIEYGYFNGTKIYPKYTYVINTFTDLMQGSSSNAKSNVLEYVHYDRFGNPLQVTGLSTGKTVSYIWGHNGLYPIAKVENLNYAEIESILGTVVLNNLNSATVSDLTVRNAVSTLRNASAARKALVESYTYRALIGMSSKTDSRGIIEYYEYDGYNRLSVVRDNDGNIVRTYCYNYKGQAIDCSGH